MQALRHICAKSRIRCCAVHVVCGTTKAAHLGVVPKTRLLDPTGSGTVYSLTDVRGSSSGVRRRQTAPSTILLLPALVCFPLMSPFIRPYTNIPTRPKRQAKAVYSTHEVMCRPQHVAMETLQQHPIHGESAHIRRLMTHVISHSQRHPMCTHSSQPRRVRRERTRVRVCGVRVSGPGWVGGCASRHAAVKTALIDDTFR